MKKQIVIIHGGETFDNYEDYLNYLKDYDISRVFEKETVGSGKRWKDNLDDDLNNKFEIFQPSMPSPRNAKYLEWKIWFEKYLPFLKYDVILIGHSLGGIFLAKYLVENDFPVKVSQLHLVAAPFDDEDTPFSLNDFVLPNSLENIEKQIKNIFFYHSEDDDCVKFEDLEKYCKMLPTAEKIIFEDRGHFIVEHFWELIKNIRK